MPAVVGGVKINAVSSSGVFHIGDVFIIQPSASLKTFAGAGSFITGDHLTVNNQNSITTTNDSDLIDDSISTIL